MSRRTLLRNAGAVAALIAGGAVCRAVDQGAFRIGQGPGYEPWVNLHDGTQGDPGEMIRAAILAANAHNTQPWHFVVSADQIDVYADRTRHTGALDPFLRELHISLGAAIENIIHAAPASGYTATVTLMPEAGEPDHVARIALAPCQPQQSDLYRAIAQRHTNRGPYEPDQAVPPALLAQLAAVSDDLAATRVFWFSTPAEREQFGAMVVRATEELIADDEQSTDNFVWQRQSWDAIHSHRDGITLETSGMPPAMAAAIKLLPPLSEKRSNTSWLNATRDLHVATAPVFGILAVRDSTDRVHQLQAGRRWQRMHLQATANGLALQPLNQPVERAVREEQLGLAPDFQARLADLTGSDWTALMTFRAGYPARAAIPSPRRDVNDVITDGAPG